MTDLAHEDDDGRAFDRTLLLRLWPYIRPYARRLAIALVLLVPIAAVHALQPYLIKLAIDDVIVPARAPSALIVIGVAYVAALAIEVLMRYFHLYALQAAGQLALHDLRVAAFAHLQRLSPAYFDRTPVGRLVTRLTSDIEALQEMFASGLITIIGDFVTLFVLMALLVALDVRLALFAFIALPVLVVALRLLQRVLRRAYRAIRIRLARINSFLSEHLSGMATIQSFDQGAAVNKTFADINASYRDMNRTAVAADAAIYTFVELLASVTVATLIWIGAGGVESGAPTLGVLVLFVETIQKFFTPIRDLSAKYAVMQSAMSGAERVFALLDTPVEIRDPESPSPIPGPRAGTPLVAFENVSFQYQRGEPVLRNVSFTVDEGERVAIVGVTGAGKTSVLALLRRFYEPSAGRVLVRGVDVREVAPDDLCRLIVGVEQEPVLFAGSIDFNLHLGDAALSHDDCDRALDAVQAGDLRNRPLAPGGNDVVERGANLSVGEKQLITFGRALVRNPVLLLLDEATSHVDPETESRLQLATSTLLQGRAAIVVAHRLSTVRNVDRVIVLHRGEKVEEGTHRALLDAGGLYARLYALQFEHLRENGLGA
ncbi:MAG: ABC transporter ATP-binding protein [Deltaproteobacteria bacterium]|nr:ABC transporter ATP-binding protein [Deltaproteobacteria bacterium]